MGSTVKVPGAKVECPNSYRLCRKGFIEGQGIHHGKNVWTLAMDPCPVCNPDGKRYIRVGRPQR